MADRTADGAHVANQRIGDERRRVEEHVEGSAQIGRALDIAMPCPGADTHMPVFSPNSLEFVDMPDIDEHNRRRKSQFQQWDEALAAGEHLRVIAVLAAEAPSASSSVAGAM